MELKPALDYEEQIERLITVHNLNIPDKEAAISILKRVNYYRLSGYGIGLRKTDNPEEYLDGISLNQIYRLYQFDSSLRNKLIHLIEQLEIQLRAQLSNFIALQYGSEGYMNVANFHDKYNKHGDSIHSIIIERFQRECQHQRNAPFVIHHMQKYQGHFPIWVAVELFTFGNLSSLYSIMKPDDQKQIAQLYGTRPLFLRSWILALVEIRNICAHYGRLYNMPLKQTPHIYNNSKKYILPGLNKLFPALITIKRMLSANEQWASFEKDLENLLTDYSDVVRLSYMGFPPNWREALQ